MIISKISHLRSVQALRATMGGNHVHDQHIVDFTACVDDALTAIQQYYDAVIETQ